MRALVYAGLLVGCAHALPPAYAAERAAAEAAYSQADYRAAAAHWQRAEGLSPNAREREDARFRRAASLERSGELEAASALYAALASSAGEHAAQAAFAQATIEISERPQQGYELLARSIERFPNSGVAANGAQRWLDHVRETEGDERERAAIQRWLERLSGTELVEPLLYRRATSLERAGEQRAAREAYLELAQRFPYPVGAHWDSALLAAARIDRAQGEYARALAELGRLLRERETSRLTGSYELQGYAEARYLIAEITRDDLNEPERAESEFHRVWSDHPTSRLADHALFEEALIAVRLADSTRACHTAQLLLEKAAESRFAGCAELLCPALQERNSGCRTYLASKIAAARSGALTSEGHSSSSR